MQKYAKNMHEHAKYVRMKFICIICTSHFADGPRRCCDGYAEAARKPGIPSPLWNTDTGTPWLSPEAPPGPGAPSLDLAPWPSTYLKDLCFRRMWVDDVTTIPGPSRQANSESSGPVGRQFSGSLTNPTRNAWSGTSGPADAPRKKIFLKNINHQESSSLLLFVI